MFGFLELLAVMFSIGLAIGVVVAVGTLLYFQVMYAKMGIYPPSKPIKNFNLLCTVSFQVKGAFKNETGIESWIIIKVASTLQSLKPNEIILRLSDS